MDGVLYQVRLGGPHRTPGRRVGPIQGPARFPRNEKPEFDKVIRKMGFR
jgi:hypothetical protein